MSTVHYQKYLNEANGLEHTDDQNKFFEALLTEVNEKRMTMNQAYKTACGGYLSFNGEGEEDQTPKGAFKGSLTLWVQNAVNNGWVSQAGTIAEGVKDKFGNKAKEVHAEIESVDQRMEKDFQKPTKGAYVGIAIAALVIGVSVYMIYKHKQKD